ncbi:50S ribosomal protein L6 [Taibaiella soli]|uniref:Large ribosomal subunit protein uL6 n=1 Tax=Taibaiella soli TaxID=1649169 RepID=A0A2W2BT62_9BACT|nr:50S ribosomal protein L6 [Taibaiella soli]PZF70953.1 50S ribosomal protein L6 [Taibaiella soli]
MSRIGKKPIIVPNGVTLTVTPANEVILKGPKGELKSTIDRDIKVELVDGQINIIRPTDQIRHRAMHGLYRALIANMVVGVTEGFSKTLELVGVGYRAAVTGQQIDMALGFSHNIIFDLPKEIKASATAEKGKNPTITLESIDKQLLGQVAAKIRGLRKPEPYKGKGVRYSGEIVRRKAGKAAGK